MEDGIVETYPTYDGLEDIISETRAWYRALGLQMGGSLFSVIRASEGITGLVHSIAKTLKMTNISKKVRIVVEEMPSIAYVTPGASQTIVHVGSWLYNRKKMEKWHPSVRSMSENDMLVLTLGLINGAVAMDMVAKSTESLRINTIRDVMKRISGGYQKQVNYVRAIEENSIASGEASVDERYVYIASAIHDILAIKACLTEHRNASWVVFPLLLFREFFDDSFAVYAKELIEKDDTLDNLIACVSSLRCFSKKSAEILDVKSSIGINIIRAMLAGTIEDVETNSSAAQSILSSEMLTAYMKEVRKVIIKPEKQTPSDDSSGSDGKDNGSKSGNSEQNGKNGNNPSGKSQSNNGMVKDIAADDASTPVNQDVAKKQLKEREQFKKVDEFGNKMQDIDEEKVEQQSRLSNNKKERASEVKARDNSNWLEEFMRLAFSGKIKLNHEDTSVPAPRSFKSMGEYEDFMRAEGCAYAIERDTPHFRQNVLEVYNSIDKVSLRNLFMERTMDIEKSQPARSGIALIPTRIVNMFTDEKIFSPLPENETERDSEVIILVDGSGSMRGNHIQLVCNDGRRIVAPLYDAVAGAAYAMAEGFQRANVACSVFVHTTLPRDDGVFVCKLTDQYSNNRMNEFFESGRISSRNNGDSYALEEVAQFFSQDGRDIGRTLIVLSDGQPAFIGYKSDRNGDSMTKIAAEKLRKEGIKVYSISLTADVVTDNNRIYGKENNFFPVDDTGNSTVSLSPMLKRIVDIVAKNSARSADNVLTQG